MTSQTEFFCNICNPGADRDHPTGYARMPGGMLPGSWLTNVTHDGAPADVCNACIPAFREVASQAPELPASALKGVTPGGWPAHASPFGATPSGFPRG